MWDVNIEENPYRTVREFAVQNSTTIQTKDLTAK